MILFSLRILWVRTHLDNLFSSMVIRTSPHQIWGLSSPLYGIFWGWNVPYGAFIHMIGI